MTEPYDIMVDDIDSLIYELRDRGMSWEDIKVEARKHLPLYAHSTMERFVDAEIARGEGSEGDGLHF